MDMSIEPRGRFICRGRAGWTVCLGQRVAHRFSITYVICHAGLAIPGRI